MHNLIIFLALFLTGIVFILIGLPLYLMKIPPNGIYGIRIPKAYESDESWYNVNKIGGGKIITAGAILMPISILFLFVPQIHQKEYEGFTVIISLCFAIAGGAMTTISGAYEASKDNQPN